VNGIVQGVGFRPFIYALANRHLLTGTVKNTSKGVEIEIQGEPDSIEIFIRDILKKTPPLAIIDEITSKEIPVGDDISFSIIESLRSDQARTLISPDISTCDDCLNELFTPSDRRYRYPFINCTNCGPRFSIIKDIPYDRSSTTMNVFDMCPDCKAEYSDPSDRRFHAQPDACSVCGPQISLLSKDWRPILDGENALKSAVQILSDGGIIAVKGMGGYHIACKADDENAVSTLRKRKYREDKPFAVMVRDIEEAKKICFINQDEEKSLLSPRKPIVLCLRRSSDLIAPSVAPGHKYLGLMLPYTPLHHLLLKEADQSLVMTSGNMSDEPIAFKDTSASKTLSDIVDAFLVHNREIYIRCDDSVVRVWGNNERLIRRSRGYVPSPIRLSVTAQKPILSCGAELKNTFCIARDDLAFMSHHIGDLENIETLTSFENGIDHFEKLFTITPEILAYDLHPEYLSTKYAICRNNIETKIGVQHHHAHIVSCLEDNGFSGPVIGVAFDGFGYGPDGTLWGGEWLVANRGGFFRAAHLKELPVPGGAAAVKQPWRMAASALLSAGIAPDSFPSLFTNTAPSDLQFVTSAIVKKLNSPLTSSMGRLFDAVSSLITGRSEVNYEGQAAIELELLASRCESAPYPFAINSGKAAYEFGTPPSVFENAPSLNVEFSETIMCIIEDLRNGIPSDRISSRFHSTVASAVLRVCIEIRKSFGLSTVALSGGVFQNMILLDETFNMLQGNGFDVLTHSRVPTNDGGISLGQCAVAAHLSANKLI